MKPLALIFALFALAGCVKPTSMRGFNEINEVATSLFRNNKEKLGYTILAQEGGSSTTSGTARYRVEERTVGYAAVRTSVFTRIEEEIKAKGFSIDGWSAYGESARAWDITGLGIAGTLRADFTDEKFGEYATIIFVAVRTNQK